MSGHYPSPATAGLKTSPSTDVFGTLSAATLADDRATLIQEEETHSRELCALDAYYRRQRSHLVHQMLQTRTRINATASISRLPDELLATIFEAYVADFWDRHFPLGNMEEWFALVRDRLAPRVKPYSWIVGVLHVCRGWRRVALATPPLWTSIAPEQLCGEWSLDFLLDHAGSLPLTVRNDKWVLGQRSTGQNVAETIDRDKSSESEELGFFYRVFQELPRIEALALKVTIKISHILERLQVERETIQLPLLRHLMLDLRGCPLDQQLLLSLFPSDMSGPFLKSLALAGAPKDLTRRLVCSSLTSLDIEFNEMVPTRDIVTVLGGLSTLQRLIVCRDAPRRAEAIPLHTTSLPSLEFLHISGAPPDITGLFSQLDIPLSASIELCSRRAPPLPPSLLSSIMPKVLGHPGVDTQDYETRGYWTRPRVIDITEHMDISVYFWRTTPTTISSSAGHHAHLDPTDSPAWSGIPRLRIRNSSFNYNLHEQLAVLDTSDVLTLTFDISNRIGRIPLHVLASLTEEMWCRILEPPAFLKLETLHIHWPNPTGEELLRALATLAERSTQANTIDCDRDSSLTVSSASTSTSSNILPLPSLKTLILQDVFSRELMEPMNSEDENLLTCLRPCAKCGYKFGALRVVDCIMQSPPDADEVHKAISGLGIADVVHVIASETDLVQPEED